MSDGVLDCLPPVGPDFLSGVYTATVQRPHLTLVLVRVVGVTLNGGIDETRARTVPVFVNGKRGMSAFDEALRTAVAMTRIKDHRRPRHPILIFKRWDTVAVPVLPRGNTIQNEIVTANGALFRTGRLGSCVEAFTTLCTHTSRVCVRQVQRALNHLERNHQSNGAMNAIEEHHNTALIDGLKHLGGLEPTKRVPEECKCTQEPTCDCYMRRMMWRAGNAYIEVFAVESPPYLTPRWNIVAETALYESWAHDQSLPVVESPLQLLVVEQWPLHASSLCTIPVPDCDDDLETLETASQSSLDEGVGYHSFLCHAVRWFFMQPTHRRDLQAFAQTIGPYYESSVIYAASKVSERTMQKHILRAVGQLPVTVQEQMYSAARTSKNGTSAFFTAMDVIGGVVQSSYDAERIGNLAVAVFAMILAANEAANVPLYSLFGGIKLFEDLWQTV